MSPIRGGRRPATRRGAGPLIVVILVGTAATTRLTAVEPAARAAYAAAAALHNREAWDLAGEEWEAFLADHPRDALAPKARCYLGICQAKTDRWPAAVATFDRVIAADTDREAVALARWELARGSFSEARSAGTPAAFTAAAARLSAMLEAAPDHLQAAPATQLLGEALWQAGRKDDALAAWRRFLTAYPDSPLVPEVLYSLGLGEADRGARVEAAATLARFAARFPGHRLAADVGLWRADLAADADDFATAESLLEEVRAAAPARAGEALDRLGRVRERRGDRPGAAAAYAAVLRAENAGPLAAGARLALGRVLLEDGQAEAARPLLEEVLAAAGDEAPAAAHLLAREALARNAAERALEIVARGEATLPPGGAPDPEAAARLALDRGDALRRLPDRRGEAVAVFDALVANGGGSSLAAGADLLAALTLVDLGEPAAALSRLEGMPGRFAGTPDAAEPLRDSRLVRAEALVALGRSTDAAAALEQFVADHPADPRSGSAWYRLGELRRDAADQAGALEAFIHCHAAAPGGARAAAALLAAGWCQASLDRLPEAIATWTTLVETHPLDPLAVGGRLARADALRRRGDAAAALADARAVVAAVGPPAQADDEVRRSTRAEARLLEGICLAETGDPAAAATVLDALLEAWPDAAVADRALHELGVARERLREPAAAAAAYTRLVERFPDSALAASAWLALGEIRFDAADYAGAAAAYTAALESEPGPSAAIRERALHKLGWSHARRGDEAAAAGAFARQIAAAGSGPLAIDGQAMLGQSLLALDRVPEARRALAAALAQPSGFSSPEMRAVAFVRATEAAARAEAWQESLDLAQAFLAAEPGSPQAPQARYAAAWALHRLGRLDDARSRYAAVASGQATELAARARLMEGEVFFEQGDHRSAIKAFFKVAHGFGGTAAPAAFHPWQAQATFEAARCFEVIAEPDKARGMYAELLDHYPDSAQAPAARERLAALAAGKPR